MAVCVKGMGSENLCVNEKEREKQREANGQKEKVNQSPEKELAFVGQVLRCVSSLSSQDRIILDAMSSVL